MADTGETTFIFKANTKPAEDSLDSFSEKVLSVGKTIGAAVAAYASFRVLVSGLEKAVDAAMEAESAVLAFNSALSLSGQYTTQASESFIEYASSLEKITGVSDEIILKNSALLVSIGKLSGEGLNKATKAALDLSRGMQIDVASAFDIVTKASQGNVMALSKYGLEVNKADTDAQKFSKTLQFINDKFGGLAEGNINTFGGALTKMKMGFEDIFESIGKVITKSPKLIALMSVIGDGFYAFSEAIAKANLNLNGMVDIFFSIGSVIFKYVLAPIEGLVRFLTSNLLSLPIIMLGIYEKLALISDKLFGTDLSSKIASMRKTITDLQQSIIAPVFGEEEMFTTRIGNSLDKTKDKVDDLASKITTALPQATIQATSGMESQWSQFFSGFSEGLKEMSKSMVDLGKQVASTFVNGFSNAFASMGKAIVKGQNVLQAFGGAILSTLGTIAIQMGQFYIAAGLATLWLNPASGMGMILAGGALATLGGVLQALGSGGESPATGGGGGTTSAGGTSTAGGNMFATQTPEEQRATPQTGVQVIVQGNILNNRESALEIASILNDAFDTNGTSVRAMA